MKNEHAQFEKNKQHIEQVEKRNLMRAVADDHLTELELVDDAHMTGFSEDAEEAVLQLEERAEEAGLADWWQLNVEAMNANSEAELDFKRQQARQLPEWCEAFQVSLPEACETTPLSHAEEEALQIAESLWAEREAKSGTAAWHAAVANKMGQPAMSGAGLGQPRLSTRVVKPRSVLEAHREPRRGEYIAPDKHQYSRTDSVWKAKVDDWMYHGGRKTRMGNGDTMQLSTQDPFPLGARCRGVLEWSSQSALAKSRRPNVDQSPKTLYARVKAAEYARVIVTDPPEDPFPREVKF